MPLKFLKKNLILLLAIFLSIFIAVMIFTHKTDRSTIKEIKIEKKTPTHVKQKIEPIKQTQEQTPVPKKKIDFMGENEPFIYSKPQLEIDQIMQEQRKIETFGEKKYTTKKREDSKIDYDIGLEDGATEKLKAGEPLKSEMVNGKVEFSKSF